MKIRTACVLALLGAFIASAAPARAEVIWDNFESGTVGEGLDGDAGGAGWNAPWAVPAENLVQNMPDGTKAPKLITDTYTAMTRTFDALTGTVYVSALIRIENFTTSNFVQIQLGNGDTAYNDKNVGFGIRNTTNLPFFARVGMDSSNSSTDFASNGTNYLLVGRISKGSSGNYEKVELWVDPADESDALAVSYAKSNFTAGIGQLTKFNVRTFQFGGGTAMYVDDVRIGASFAEVVPEPATLGLLAIGGLGLLARRRRT